MKKIFNHKFWSLKVTSLICCAMVLCTAFSSIHIIPTAAQATKEKVEMLYVEGAAKSRLSAEYELEKNATYTVYFKYRIESGSFGLSDSRSCVFSDIWSGNTHHGTQNSTGKNVFLKGDGEEGFNDIELTFTNDLETTNKHTHDLGLGFWGDTKLYIADYRFYKIEGEQKTLLDSGFGNWNKKTGTVSVKKEDYDEKLFADQMLNLKANGSAKYGLKIELEDGAKYKIYYKYKVEEGIFGISDSRTIVFADRATNGTNNVMHSTHLSNEPNPKYPKLQVPFEKGTSEDGFNDISLTFTASNDYANDYNVHFLEFQFWRGVNSIYIADFRIYKIDGDKELLIESGFDSMKAFDGAPTATRLDYNESLFKKQMLNLKNDSASKYGVKAALEDGKKYKVYFKYKVEEGIFGISDHRTITFADRGTNGTNQVMHSTHLSKEPNPNYPKLQVPFEKGTSEDGFNDISLTFTASNDYCNDYNVHFLEFQFWRGVNSIYIADFRIYKIDGDKELLIESEFASMQTIEGTPTAALSDYNESIFKEQMVKISGEKGSKYGIKVSLAKGKQYKIYFKYKVEEGTFGISNSRSIVFSDINASNQNQTFHSTHLLQLGSENYPELQKPFEKDIGSDEWNDIKLTMTAATKYVDDYNNHLLMFNFWSGSNTIYVADFKIYSVVDGKEVLIETTTNGMEILAGSPSVEYSDYNENLFKEQMLKLSGNTGAKYALTVEMRKDVKYKAYFKYKVEKGYFGTGDNRTIVFSVYNPINMTYQYASHYTPDDVHAFEKGGGENGWNDIELTFTGKQLDKSYNNHMLSFDLWNAENEIYLADFRLYRVENGEEHLVEAGFSGFKVKSGEVSVEETGYNSDLFNSKKDYMLQIYDLNYYGTKADRYIGKDAVLSSGKKYKIALKYYFQEGNIQHNNVNLIVADVPVNGKIPKVYYTSDEADSSVGQFEKTSQKTVAIDEFVFTAPKNGTYYIAFEIKDRVVAFISEISVSDIEESTEGTVLYEDFSDSLNGWHSLTKYVAKNDTCLFDNFRAEIVNEKAADEIRLFSRNDLPRQMLYFELGEGMRRWLSAAFRGTPGEKFKARVSVGGVLDPFSGVVAVSNNHRIAISPAGMSAYTYEGGSYTAEFEFTVPKYIKDSNYNVEVGDSIFFGLIVPANSSGYILDFSVWRAEDKSETNVIKNNDFKMGVANWGFYWEDGLQGFSKDMLAPFEVSTDNGMLKVMDYNAETYRLHGDDTYYNDGTWWKSDDYNENAAETSCSINGVVYDKSNKKLSGIKLSLEGNDASYTATTNSGGKFSFNNIPAGFYELYIIKSDGTKISTGYFTTLSDGDTASVQVEYNAEYITENTVIEDNQKDNQSVVTGDIVGVVYTPKRNVIPGMTLYLRGVENSVKTDENGYFEFTGLTPGEYELYTIDENNEEYVFRTITVKENVKLSIKLKYDNSSNSVSNAENGNTPSIWIFVSAGIVLMALIFILLLFVLKKRQK